MIMVAMVDTPARRELRRKLRTASQVSLATALGIKQPTVSSWARGKTRPEAHYRFALWALWDIHPFDWLTREERAIVARATSCMSSPKELVLRAEAA